MTTERPGSQPCGAMAKAREGREQQVYTPSGARIVVGVVPVVSSGTQIVLVSSRKHPDKWILPKGGWEDDETQVQSAVREAYEEAGLRGTIPSAEPLGRWPHHKQMAGSLEPSCEFVFFAMQVSDLEEDWPERSERSRKLFTVSQAREIMPDQPAMLSALSAFEKTNNSLHTS
ncbi:NUDIX hydrolase domain-like protein [Phlyctochytrium arcticum]|nr:NUDIX hydrolase domain-like protein [Phlyctochytrium arcticum]